MRWQVFGALVLGAMVLALVGKGCGDGNGDEDTKEDLPRTPPLEWVSAEVLDFVISIPKPWAKDNAKRAPDTWQFRGPEDRGFRPVVLLIWPRKWSKSQAEWVRYQRDKRVIPGGDARLLEEGTSSVAGTTAGYLVYRLTTVHPKTRKKMKVLTIDWCISGGGKAGLLRCLAEERTFAVTYRPIFDEIARRLRFK